MPFNRFDQTFCGFCSFLMYKKFHDHLLFSLPHCKMYDGIYVIGNQYTAFIPLFSILLAIFFNFIEFSLVKKNKKRNLLKNNFQLKK